MNCGFQTCEIVEKEIGHVNFYLTFVRSNLKSYCHTNLLTKTH